MSKFLDHLLDFETFVPKADGKWPSLKVVFDNLRYYPILALYGVVLRTLSKPADLWATVAFWFLTPIFVFLLIACLVQTAVMLSVLTVGIISIYIAPSVQAPQFLREHKSAVAALGLAFLVLLVIAGLVSAFHLLTVISKLVPGA